MKFRIKAKNLESPKVVEFESPTVTVLQFKTKIADIFQLKDAESST